MATVYYNSAATGADDGTSEADAFDDLQTALSSLSAGDHLYCKNGSSREGSQTVNLSFSGPTGSGPPVIIEGYGSTPGDGIRYQTASPCVWSGSNWVLKYFDIDKGADGTDAYHFGNADGWLMYRCKGTSTYNYGSCTNLADGVVVECEFYGKSVQNTKGILNLQRCDAINNYVEVTDGVSSGVRVQTGYRVNSLAGNLIVYKGSTSPTTSAGVVFHGSNNSNGGITYQNTVVGFDYGFMEEDGNPLDPTKRWVHFGNLFYDGIYGFFNREDVNSHETGHQLLSTAIGSMTSGQTDGKEQLLLDTTTLTASPFAETTDYTINSTSGGGALIRGLLGHPNPHGYGATRVNFPTHGARQPDPDAGGGGGGGTVGFGI